MMYCKYNAETGEVHSFCNVKKDDDYIECTMPPARTSDAQTMKWHYLEGTHENYLVGYWTGSDDPLDAPASIDLIKSMHSQLESSPVEVFGVLMDADLLSEKRMADCIETLDFMPIKKGSVEEIKGVKVRFWKDANNEWHPLSKTDIEAVLAEMIKRRGVRASILFDRLQELKSTAGQHTIRQISDSAYWLSDDRMGEL